MADRYGFRDDDRWRDERDWDENRDRFSGGFSGRPDRDYGPDRDFGWQGGSRDYGTSLNRNYGRDYKRDHDRDYYNRNFNRDFGDRDRDYRGRIRRGLDGRIDFDRDRGFHGRDRDYDRDDYSNFDFANRRGGWGRGGNY